MRRRERHAPQSSSRHENGVVVGWCGHDAVLMLMVVPGHSPRRLGTAARVQSSYVAELPENSDTYSTTKPSAEERSREERSGGGCGRRERMIRGREVQVGTGLVKFSNLRAEKELYCRCILLIIKSIRGNSSSSSITSADRLAFNSNRGRILPPTLPSAFSAPDTERSTCITFQ